MASDDKTAEHPETALPAKAAAAVRRRQSAVARRARGAATRAKAIAAPPAVRQRVKRSAAEVDRQIEEASNSIDILRQRVDALMAEASSEAHTLGAQVRRSSRGLARQASRQVSEISGSARQHPLPIVVGLGLITLLAGLFASQQRYRR